MKTVKTRKAKLIIIACILPLLFVACSNDDGNPNEPQGEPFPFLKVGNRWTYQWIETLTDERTIYYDNSVSILSKANDFYSIKANIMTKSYPEGLAVDDNGDTVWSFVMLHYSYTNAPTDMWFANNDYYAKMDGTKLPFPIIFSNNTVGKKWESPFKDRDLGALYREILSTSETVEIDLGTFTNCIKVKETCERDPEYYYIYWISKEYGIVKYEKRKFEYRFDVQQYVVTKGELRWKNF